MNHYSIHQLPAMNLALFFLRPVYRSPASRERLGPEEGAEGGRKRPTQAQTLPRGNGTLFFSLVHFTGRQGCKNELARTQLRDPELENAAGRLCSFSALELKESLGKC